jgi:hypothetical protein
MKILELIFNAASGGLVGILGQFLVGWMESRRLDADSRRKIAEIQAIAAAKADEAALQAFTAAQNAAAPAENAPAWCAAVLTLVRPALTLLLLSFAVFVYYTATPAVRADITGETLACAFGAVWFWFGSRYQSRLRQK